MCAVWITTSWDDRLEPKVFLDRLSAFQEEIRYFTLAPGQKSRGLIKEEQTHTHMPKGKSRTFIAEDFFVWPKIRNAWKRGTFSSFKIKILTVKCFLFSSTKVQLLLLLLSWLSVQFAEFSNVDEEDDDESGFCSFCSIFCPSSAIRRYSSNSDSHEWFKLSEIRSEILLLTSGNIKSAISCVFFDSRRFSFDCSVGDDDDDVRWTVQLCPSHN